MENDLHFQGKLDSGNPVGVDFTHRVRRSRKGKRLDLSVQPLSMRCPFLYCLKRKNTVLLVAGVT
jgi:hypothetical protein